MSGEIPLQEVALHGHRVGFRIAGEGPVILLIHGITSTSDVWLAAMARLAERYTVVAPDLLGHGRSAKPRGDYSLGAYASGARDLLGVLGFERGTVVGHSLGGGIALQFAYQFPEYTERLALVSSGGLGKEVHPLLRAAALPGAELVLPLIIRDWAIGAGAAVAGFLGRLGISAGPGPRRGGARLRLARRPRRARGVPAHAARGRRSRGPAGQRHRPPVPGREAAHPADLGQRRPDHPDRARPRRASADPRKPPGRDRGRRALAPARRSRPLRRRAQRVRRNDRAPRVRSRPDAADAEARARTRRRDRLAPAERADAPAQASSRSPCASGSCLSFFSVLFSIWRTRSRVTPKARPTSSSVSGSCPRSP